MKTETETQTKPETAVNVNLETKPETKTAKPKRAKKTAPATADFSQSLTGPKPVHLKTLTAELGARYPELPKLFDRLRAHGLNNFKFDFGYAPAIDRPAKRTTDFFYVSFPDNRKPKPVTAELGKSADYKITGKTYRKIFSELGNLFDRFTKNGAGHYRLNFSYAHAERPTKRIEHKIYTNYKPNYLD